MNITHKGGELVDQREENVPKPASTEPVVTFTVERDNPFQSPFCESDVALVVEGKKLHVHKSVLSLHSPVLHAMLCRHFAEKETHEIEVKDQKHDVMVEFLKQMYPVHSLKPIQDDEALVNILTLADFYQAEHVRIKCEAYIDSQLQNISSLSTEKKMLYLLVCDKFSVTKYLDTMLGTVADLPIDTFKANEHFQSLPTATKMDLLERRCRLTEARVESMKTKPEVERIPIKERR